MLPRGHGRGTLRGKTAKLDEGSADEFVGVASSESRHSCVFAQGRLAHPWRQSRKWIAVSEANWGRLQKSGTGCWGTCPSRACTLVYHFSNFELDFFFSEKEVSYLASVVSLPWCVVCFRTVPVITWPGPQPKPGSECPGVCALRLFLQSSWWSGPLCISVWSLGSAC